MLEAIDIVAAIRREHGADFQKCAEHRADERGIGEMFHHLSADEERHCFLRGKHDGRQVIALHQAVAHAGLAHDRHPCLTQRGDVAIDRAHADFEMFCKFLGFNETTALHDITMATRRSVRFMPPTSAALHQASKPENVDSVAKRDRARKAGVRESSDARAGLMKHCDTRVVIDRRLGE